MDQYLCCKKGKGKGKIYDHRLCPVEWHMDGGFSVSVWGMSSPLRGEGKDCRSPSLHCGTTHGSQFHWLRLGKHHLRVEGAREKKWKVKAGLHGVSKIP